MELKTLLYPLVIAFGIQVLLSLQGEEPSVPEAWRRCSVVSVILSHSPDAAATLTTIRSIRTGLTTTLGGLSCVVVGDTSAGPTTLLHHWANDSTTLFYNAGTIDTVSATIPSLLSPLNPVLTTWATLVIIVPLAFTTFAQSRNNLLASLPAFINATAPPSTPVLLLDAGDVLVVHDVAATTRTLAASWQLYDGQPAAAASSTIAPALLVCQRWHQSGSRHTEYFNLRLLPLGSLPHYRYEGAVHEYLVARRPTSTDGSPSLPCNVLSLDQDRDAYGATSTGRWARDARILGEERASPSAASSSSLDRATFYHAQTLSSLGCRRAATDAFLARTAMAGFHDEVVASWIALASLDPVRFGTRALRETGRAEVAMSIAAEAAARGDWQTCASAVASVRRGEARLPATVSEYSLFVDVSSVTHAAPYFDAVCTGNASAAVDALRAAPTVPAWWRACVLVHRIPGAVDLLTTEEEGRCVPPVADGIVRWTAGTWTPTRGFIARAPTDAEAADRWLLEAVGGDAFSLTNVRTGCHLAASGVCAPSNEDDSTTWFARRSSDGAFMSMVDGSVLLPQWPLTYDLTHDRPRHTEPAALTSARATRWAAGRHWLATHDTSLDESAGVPSMCGAAEETALPEHDYRPKLGKSSVLPADRWADQRWLVCSTACCLCASDPAAPDHDADGFHVTCNATASASPAPASCTWTASVVRDTVLGDALALRDGAGRFLSATETGWTFGAVRATPDLWELWQTLTLPLPPGTPHAADDALAPLPSDSLLLRSYHGGMARAPVDVGGPVVLSSTPLVPLSPDVQVARSVWRFVASQP
mmetsp:Transcript_4575/g.14823  ORF Transcript_4575/g.14823 Transcript_4575/m.14823 type:complete len:819 (-) Transcript_4575:28-2484(-)